MNPYFNVCGYKIVSERMHGDDCVVQAIVEVRVAGQCVRQAATGVGPVDALDRAFRACLDGDFPEVRSVRLKDYRVAVEDAASGTAASVRVDVVASDGASDWAAVGRSVNIIDASFAALCHLAVAGIDRTRALVPQHHSTRAIKELY